MRGGGGECRAYLGAHLCFNFGNQCPKLLERLRWRDISIKEYGSSGRR
jgi:hypothetical protein